MNRGIKILKIILLSIAGLVLVFVVLTVALGWGEKPDKVEWSQTRLCKQVDSKWLDVESFSQGENLQICGYIQSNNPNLEKQVDVRIYREEIKSQIFAIYHDLIWVTNGDVVLPINKELKAGTYVISINLGRKILDIIEMKITE